MKQQLKKISKKEDGFTIIEVLIVLAIAALILVVVLVAIPQLQRNQRNSARQSDAARVVTSVQNWSANNNGQVFPADPNPDGPGALVSVVNDLGGLTQYDIAENPADSDLEAAEFTTSLGTVPDLTTIRIVPGASCTNNPAPGSVTNTDVASRNVAVQYAVEQAGNQTEGRCVDS